VTGAGDTLVESVLVSLVQGPRGFEDPESLKRIVEYAQAVAALTLRSGHAVSHLFLGMILLSISRSPYRRHAWLIQKYFCYEEHIVHISTEA
jgi:sugar/nucleoside kinase (ribokinase family)